MTIIGDDDDADNDNDDNGENMVMLLILALTIFLIEFIQESNPQELPESELKELVDLGNVRWKTFRLRFWGGGAAFYVHGAQDDDID